MTIDRADDSKILESDHHYESNLESDVRFEIESNQEASQVLTIHPFMLLRCRFNAASAAGDVNLEHYARGVLGG